MSEKPSINKVSVTCPKCGHAFQETPQKLFGTIRTPAKAKAAAKNGSKGGRPRIAKSLKELEADKALILAKPPGKKRNQALNAITKLIKRHRAKK